MTEVEKAYIAGVIDSDGSIGICTWNKDNTRSHRIVVQVMMKDSRIPYWLEHKAGGKVYITSKDGTPLYKWMIINKYAKELCQDIAPYLVEKVIQAQYILDFPIHRVGQKFTEEGNNYRELLKELISKHNTCHKGAR